MFRIIGTICSGDPDASVSYTVGTGSIRVASSCAKYCITTLWPTERWPESGASSPDRQPHQRRLADAVRSDERDAIAALDVQIHVTEDSEIAVRLARVLQLEHRPPALGARRKIEVDRLALGRDFDQDDLFQHLDAALDLRRFGRLVAEPVDEQLHARDFLVLLAFRLAQGLDAR